jgi:geranylgeranyl pyrophosphate synthase
MISFASDLLFILVKKYNGIDHTLDLAKKHKILCKESINFSNINNKSEAKLIIEFALRRYY